MDNDVIEACASDLDEDEVFMKNFESWVPLFDSQGSIVCMERNVCPTTMDRNLEYFMNSDLMDEDQKLTLMKEVIKTIEVLQTFVGNLTA